MSGRPCWKGFPNENASSLAGQLLETIQSLRIVVSDVQRDADRVVTRPPTGLTEHFKRFHNNNIQGGGRTILGPTAATATLRDSTPRTVQRRREAALDQADHRAC